MIVGNPITIGGGTGMKNAYAVIAVEYPFGSICTCSNGDKTLKSNGNGGAWAFGVPNGGEWVVECHNAVTGQSQSTTVNITRQGVVVKVLLVYTLTLIPTNKPTEIWTGEKAGTSSWLEYESDHISTGAYTNNSHSSAYTINPYDLTAFSQIRISVQSLDSNTSTSGRGMFFYVGTEPKIGQSGASSTTSKIEFSSGTNHRTGEFLLDISALSGEYYIGVTSWKSNGANAGITLDSIIVE